MRIEKQTIIQRLFEKEMITLEEVMILSESEKEFVPVPYPASAPAPVFPQPVHPIFPQPYMPSYPQYPQTYPNPMDQWANDEMNRRMEIADRCSCNPKNGGSGICGCTLTGPVIYCTTKPVNSMVATFTIKSNVSI